MDTNAVEAAAVLLRDAQAVCVSTGAGMSKESGMETFRDDDTGLWAKFNPAELATPQAFARDPEKVWEWYRWRRAQLREIEPHDGHRVLARWPERVADFTLVTQNVDGLHHRAGSPEVVELHGRLDVARCTFCDYSDVGLEDLGPDPACPVCMKRMRPGVVWFGEPLPMEALNCAFAAAERCDVFVLIGTSGVVQPAASLADSAKVTGGKVIEVNPNESELSHLADVALRAGCRDALVALDEAWRRVGS